MKTGLKGFLALLIGFVIVSLFWYVLSAKFINVPDGSDGTVAGFKGMMPVLNTPDVRETIGFYKDSFGFEKKDSFFDEGEYQWAVIEKDSLKIMLQNNDSLSVIDGTVSLIVKVEDIDKLYEQLKNKCEIVEPMDVTPEGGKGFSVKDNNGYVVIFRM